MDFSDEFFDPHVFEATYRDKTVTFYFDNPHADSLLVPLRRKGMMFDTKRQKGFGKPVRRQGIQAKEATFFVRCKEPKKDIETLASGDPNYHQNLTLAIKRDTASADEGVIFQIKINGNVVPASKTMDTLPFQKKIALIYNSVLFAQRERDAKLLKHGAESQSKTQNRDSKVSRDVVTGTKDVMLTSIDSIVEQRQKELDAVQKEMDSTEEQNNGIQREIDNTNLKVEGLRLEYKQLQDELKALNQQAA